MGDEFLSRLIKAACLLSTVTGLPLAAKAQTVADLNALSIEELVQVQVTSVSKRPEPLAEAPAAIYVIGTEDILRSSATSLPEALRLAPNLQVQHISARQYAISARGFNGYETANKMLALIDGRSIYTTLFSGILWELHHPVLEDIQQIEVVSGPGGTLYGPNAVNGVISIKSKPATETIGGLARGTVAANERTAVLRYGLPLGSDGAVRFYGNYFAREGQPAGSGGDADDDFKGYQLGFRMDMGGADNRLTLQGDWFDTQTDVVDGDGERGHNILGRWTRALGADTSLQVQAYYDKYRRDFVFVADQLETFDASAQLNTLIGAHHIVVGGGVRTTKDLFDNDLNPFVLTPERKRLWVANAFVQDEFALTSNLDLTAGIKLENSSFSGLELLPNVRLAWRLSDSTLLWGSVSRAVRTPSRIDRQLNFLPILAQADDFQSEQVTAIEAGYRGQPTRRTSLSVSLFYNIYDRLRTTELAPDGGLPIRLANGLKGRTWGVEAWATHQMAPWWRLKLGVATLSKRFREKDGHQDITQGTDGVSTGNDPDFKIMARSEMALTDRLTFDAGVRRVDDLEQPRVDAYTAVDARLGWRATDRIELYVAGSNLFDEVHDESGFTKGGQRVQRSIHAGTRLRF